jgi:excisionase family DNA binding protein
MSSQSVEFRSSATESSLSEDLLTPEQVARRLRVSPRWVRDHATRRSPRIPAVDLGSRVRFRPSDVEEFIRQRIQGSSQKNRRV